MKCEGLLVAQLSVLTLAQSAIGQPGTPAGLSVKGPIVPPTVLPSDGVIAALPYDGNSLWGSPAQDFEPAFDCYDVFVIEDFEIFEDARVTSFTSRGFGGGAILTEDFIGRIFTDAGDGLPGQDEFTGELVMTTVPGAGFYDGEDFVSSFSGQCLGAGRYLLVYHTRLDFGLGGTNDLFHQAGPPTVGGGEPDNAWHWNPGGCFGAGSHWRITGNDREPTGINYVIAGVPANCECLADLDIDGDLDAEDFFAYLDLFASGSELADFTGDEPGVPDGVIDADDFFFYLDLFAAGCA